MKTSEIVYYPDCRHFRGEIPCKPHKESGVHCEECPHYDKLKGIILIIKLGAIGDVIRTTPLLHKIKKELPDYAIWWLTNSPEVLPQNEIDKILKFNDESLLVLQATEFVRIINLDKDCHACALLKNLKAEEKFGFTLMNGKTAPVNSSSEHKFITGIFDDVNKANSKSYPEEIFELCGWKFRGEEYLINKGERLEWTIDSDGRKIVGLNTGCGGRWTTRLWKEENWLSLIQLLTESGYFPLLLGGEQEHEKNLRLSLATNALYLGHFPLNQFISLVDQCDIVVTAVTMALHIAIGLQKQVILFNNIFNPKEFELYGRGKIIEPDKPCTCFFSPECKNKEYFCMDYLHPKKVIEMIKSIKL
ncbi:MAG: glycosyltransferase family 9 protein [Bacteroidetes bacterium]|nr:MAG: glycosyltransferase family 9 protein [Bacteroidota bacterium]